MAASTPARVFYDTVIKYKNDGKMTDASPLMDDGHGSKKMDRPQQAGRSKRKNIAGLDTAGQPTLMSYVYSNNYTNYKKAADFLTQAQGLDYAGYPAAFAQQYGTNRIETTAGSKKKKATSITSRVPDEWFLGSNVVATASLSPKRTATGKAAASSSAAPEQGYAQSQMQPFAQAYAPVQGYGQPQMQAYVPAQQQGYAIPSPFYPGAQ
jgi:hypothetical protein